MPMAAGRYRTLDSGCDPLDAEVTITDLVGDGDHYAARVVSLRRSPASGTRVRQQFSEFMALGSLCIGNELHALQLTTVVPRRRSVS